jgi:sigma-B regulation protein RsbU (phosphoserine phosphatase)
MVYFVIGDVSGKGVTAAMLMAGLQASFRIFAKSDPTPAELVTQLNVALKENLPQSKFVTLFLGRLDTRSGVVEYANAGHVPPLLVGGDAVRELDETDLLLGVMPVVQYGNRHVTLAPGESLVLFTDGVSEAEDLDGNQLSSAQLAGWLENAQGVGAEEIIRRIEARVLEHIGETPLDDDVTIMVISRKA